MQAWARFALQWFSFVCETNHEDFDTLYEHVHFALHQLKELLELHRCKHCANGFEHFTNSFTNLIDD